MQFYDAKVADIVRCVQRDQLFVEGLQEDIFSICKALGSRNYTRLRKVVPILANTWYYFVTSLHNIQTLGEEYTGTLRLTGDKKVPNKLLQILWLALYVGGESLYDRLSNHMQNRIVNSDSLVENAKKELLKCIRFLKDNKFILLRMHHSLFYIDGAYYNLSNRITGIRYVLLRQWLQDDSYTGSFKILGKMSLLYLLCTLIQQGTASQKVNLTKTEPQTITPFTKLCSLCAENRKNTCATPCGHLFCWECIYDSLNYQPNCPLCREIINPSRIIFLQNDV